MNQIFLFITLAFLLSCSGNKSGERISGTWKCVQWTRGDGIKTADVSGIVFRFHPDYTYYSRIRSAEDSGSYSFIDSNLHVRPAGKMEMAVKILKLTPDSLVFLMNSGGIRETMTLLKEK